MAIHVVYDEIMLIRALPTLFACLSAVQAGAWHFLLQ